MSAGAWYRGISRYQWLIFFLASAGWVFDVYEGQIFNLTREHLLEDILGPDQVGNRARFYGDAFLGVFLLGGMLGGLLFGSLADRWGRKPTLALTILVYSLFSGLTYWAQSLWQVGLLRFLVALGVGGEWSVAAALVAEVFPARARAQASSFFHATSVIGTSMAALVALAVGDNWRYAYLVGVMPALLILGVRLGMVEAKRRRDDPQRAASAGSIRELLTNVRWRKRAFLGLLLAAIGLGTFWAVYVEGQALVKGVLLSEGSEKSYAVSQAKLAYGTVQALAGGLGLAAFGPLSVRWGRRLTFVFFHIGAFLIVPVAWYLPTSYLQVLAILPLYGFLTLGMHAGYAVYFPELFPSHLRATGAGFCFNGARLLGATMLFLSASLKEHVELPSAVTILSTFFLLGIPLVCFLPETQGQSLPE